MLKKRYINKDNLNIITLRRKYGFEGYGLYIALLCILEETPTHKYSFNQINTLAIALEYDVSYLRSFITILSKINLFKTDNNFFWSQMLIDDKKRKQKKDKMLLENDYLEILQNNMKLETIAKQTNWNIAGVKWAVSRIYDYCKYKNKWKYKDIPSVIRKWELKQQFLNKKHKELSKNTRALLNFANS